MSLQAVQTFRERVGASAGLQAEVRKAIAAGGGGLVAMGKKQGLEFTPEELEAATKKGELTPFELEIVSAGGLDLPSTY